MLAIRINPEQTRETIDSIEKTWQAILPNNPFIFTFLDEDYNNLYENEVYTGRVYAAFSLLSIFIACLGLFGLASFTAEKRTKEIGIRKVLGASVSGLVLLVSKEFTKWIILANIVAWPIAYLAMNNWLQNFAYRINIGLWIFLLAGALALVIALLTVCGVIIGHLRFARHFPGRPGVI
jgi:putative ABC transport system permease protein